MSDLERRSRFWIAVAAVIAASACATEVVTVPVAASNARTWAGRTRQSVVSVWGVPNETEPDAQGGEILIYRDSKNVPVVEPVGGRDVQRDAMMPQYETTGSRHVAGDVRAKFWVDARGTVYRFWFAPEVYKKGDVYPPPLLDAEE